MSTLEMEGQAGTGVNREQRIRSGVAVAFALGIATFFVWFIATHMTRYPS